MKVDNFKIIKRGKITYVIYNDKVIVSVGGGQYVSYNKYVNWNKRGITKFIKCLLKSNVEQYTTAVDQISLARECKVIGTSVSKPKELE